MDEGFHPLGRRSVGSPCDPDLGGGIVIPRLSREHDRAVACMVRTSTVVAAIVRCGEGELRCAAVLRVPR